MPSTRQVPHKIRVLILLAGIFLSIPVAYGQNLPPIEADALKHLADSPRHGEWVKYKAGPTDLVDAWVVYPERATKAPVVIIIHEIFGLSDWVRAVADQYAAEGFIAIAPDFLSGKAPDGKGGSAVLGAEGARRAIADLDPKELIQRLDGAAAYATTLPAATQSFAVVGFCWGGGISFAWATQQPKLAASVVFYGTSPATASLAGIQAPVLGLYGGADARVDATIPDAQAEMKRLGKSYAVEIYPGAGHAFLRQQNGQNGANLVAAQKGWVRSVNFLREALEKTQASLRQANPVTEKPADLHLVFANAADCLDNCDDNAPLPSALSMRSLSN